MSIDLTSRLSAITEDSAGITHLVWVEGANLWHAVYDSNSATWINAESIAEIGTQSITNLNLIANDSLIYESGSTSTNLPGLAVVYQQGKDNDSNFFYTAAQYNANGNLQWLDSPQALTADQVGDLEPRAIAYEQNGITDVLVVGQKVNLDQTANLGIREDTDLYYQTFSVNSNQFASSSNPVSSTDASYTPQTSKDGVVQGNLYFYSEQTATAPAASYSVLSPAEASSAVSNTVGQGYFWNSSVSFGTNLASLNLFQNPPGASSSILSRIFNNIKISGSLLGTSGNDPELTLFGGGDSTDGLLLNGSVSLGSADKSKDPNDSDNKDQNSSLSPSIILSTLYSYTNDPANNFPLNNITGSLALGLGLNIPIWGYEGEAFKASLDFVGSIGLVFQWQVVPASPGSYTSPIGAYLKSNSGNSGEAATLTAVADVPVTAAAAAIALVIGSSISDAVNASQNNLTAESYLLGIPISAGLEGKIEIPFVFELSASAKIFLAGTLGRTNQEKDTSFTLGFPLSATIKLLGFLGGTIEVFPSWTWGTVPSDTPSASSPPTTSLANVSPLATLSESSATTSPTASVNGSLLSIAFPTALDTQINPAPTEFTVTVTDASGNLVNIPVFDVIVQENSVILRLEQTIPYSTLNDQPFSDIQVSYIPSNTPLTDTQGQLIPSFTDLAVTNNTSQNFVYFYNPTSGTDNNYASTQQQIAINFNTSLNTNSDAIPLTSQFIVTSSNGQTINFSAVAVNQNSVTLTLAQNIPSGDTYTVQYTPNPSRINNLQDASGKLIRSFTSSSTTSPTEAGIVNSTFASNATINPLIANLSKDFAQDSPPALAPTVNGTNVLIAWSSDTPPITPVSAVTDGSKIYLTFADNLNNAISQLPTNSQFTITINGNQSNVTVSNVALDENTIILNLSNNIQASDTIQVVYSLNTNSANYNSNLNLTDETNTLLWVPAFQSNLTFTGNNTVAPQQLQAGGLSNLLTLTFDQVLNTDKIPNGSQFTVFINNDTATVNNVNVYATSVTLTLAQTIAQGDVVSISYNTISNTSDNLASNSNGTLVNNFTTNNVITTSSSPGTVIKVGNSNNNSNFSSIPGTSGLNFDVAAVLDQQTQSNVIAWVHADEVDLPPLSISGQVYTSEQTTLINKSLNASDIYYSVLGANNQWSIAAPLVTQQPGQDTNVTLGEGPNGELMAAWLNTQQDSNGDTTTTINWSSWNGTSWTTPQIVLSESTPDPATNLSISSLNNQPAIFWTETQVASYSTNVFDQNPLIYLRLADLNGTTAKNSGQLLGSANGTYSGDFTLRQGGALEDTTTQTGDPNPAVLFNGGGVTLNTAIPITNQGFTVEFWFKLPSLLSASQTTLNLVSIAGVFTLDLEDLTGGTALSFSLANANANTDNSQIQTLVDGEGQTIQTDDWYYVVGTYSGPNQTLSLYLNGSLVGSLSNISFSNLPDSGTLTLAGSSGSVYLDEVAFYPSVLTYSDVSAANITAANFQNITGNQLVDLISGANQIGNHYDAQYVKPLPPGPQTHYSIWDSSSQSWETPSQIDPILKPVATSLSDANNPIWDIVSDSVSPASGSISPNGRADYVFQISLTGQQTQTIVGMVLSVYGTNIVWTVGTDQNGKLLSPSNSNAWQLGVVLGDTLLNSLNPDSPSFNYRVMGNSETFTLFGDTSEAIPTSTANPVTVTVYFEGNDTQLTVPATQQPNSGGAVSANSTDILGTTVLGIATVTEANDSSLSLIDSGFVINTNNSAIGSVLASAFNSNGSLAYVAVGNRGYTDSQGNPLNSGTVQVLFNRGDVLTDSESNPLTVTDLTGNPDGVLITGLTDTGTANKNVAIALATGDVDGDGIDDLVIGDANANEGNGVIYVFYGSYLNSLKNQNQTIDVSQLSATPSNQGFLINGLDTNGFAGFSVAVGNFNGDNYEDIAFGAPLASNDEGIEGVGKIYVVNGFAQSSSSDLTPTLIHTGRMFPHIPDSNPATPAGTFVTVGEGAGFFLGVSHYTVGGATTFSGSTTTDDLFIGAPNYQIKVTNQWNGNSGLPSDSQSLYPDKTWIAAGAVHVFSSSQGSFKRISTYTGPGVPGANGVAANYFAGTAIASQDLDGDGQQDLAISATGVNSNTGAVYVVSGKTASESANPQDLSLISNLIINGGLTGSQTGTVITSPGDLNDDGYQDFLITSPQAANGAGQNYLLFGPLNLADVGTIFDLNVTANDNKTTFLLNGSEPLQLTGSAAIGIGDINGDGVDDVMLTAPNAQQAYAVFGHSWLADDGSIKLTNISANNGFVIDGQEVGLTINGTIVEMLGDINNDGFADVFSGGADGGVIIFGNSTKDLIDGSWGTSDLIINPNGFEITQVLALGDYNGDGLPDFGVVGNNLQMYIILGSSSLGSAGEISLSSSSASVAIGDVTSAAGDYNGDGYTDVVSSVNQAPYKLVLQESGDLVIQSSNGSNVWTAPRHNGNGGADYVYLAGNDGTTNDRERLAVFPGLNNGSSNVGYSLVMQANGNLVEYQVNADGTLSSVWDSNTAGNGGNGNNVTMQSDGNLVIRDSDNTFLWASNTNGDGQDQNLPNLAGYSLALFSDGTLGFVIKNNYSDPTNPTYIAPYNLYTGSNPPSSDSFFFPYKYPFTILSSGDQLTAGTTNNELYTPTSYNGASVIVNPFSSLILGDDGYLFVQSLDGAINTITGTYSSGTPIFALVGTQALLPGIQGLDTLYTPATNSYVSNNGDNASGILYTSGGNYTLSMQSDGNLVETENSTGNVVWSSGTSGSSGAIATILNNTLTMFVPTTNYLVIQNDGNLVLYNNGDVAWASGTAENESGSHGLLATSLLMQSDGNLLLLTDDGEAVWASNTNGDGQDQDIPTCTGDSFALLSDGSLGFLQNNNNGTYTIDYFLYKASNVYETNETITPASGQIVTVLQPGQSLTANSSNNTLYKYSENQINNSSGLYLTLGSDGGLYIRDVYGDVVSTLNAGDSNLPYSVLTASNVLAPNNITYGSVGGQLQFTSTLFPAQRQQNLISPSSQFQLFLGGQNISLPSTTLGNIGTNNIGSLAGIGDLDGDGYSDLATGTGQVFIAATGGFKYSSSVQLIPGNSPINQIDSTSSGSTYRDLSCFITSTSGDFNGDGLNDLLVASPVLHSATIAQVFAGNTDITQTLSNSPVLTITYNVPSIGQNNSYYPFLSSAFYITSVGDINGDGYDDLLASIPDFVNSQDTDAGYQGMAYVIFGGSTIETIDLNNLSPTQGFAITGLPNSQAGYSISGGEDINGDGFSDFVIGAPSNSDNLSYVIFGSDFNLTVNQTGTIGDDVMIGTPTGESFVASQGNDLIKTNGGLDVVYAGPGDDWVMVSDTYFRRLDGGTGTDTLQLTGYNGQDWDLTTLASGLRLRDFETLDTRNYGANSLTLNSLTVMKLSSNNQLTVLLDDQDSLNLSSDFNYTGTVYQDNQRFYQYQSNRSAATLFVNQPLGQATYQLVLNTQGSLVLLSPSGETVWTATDSNGNTITGAQQALMQTDGNFVLYDSVQPVNQPGSPSAALWATGTSGEAGAYLCLESNGSLVIVSANSPDIILYPGTAENSTATSNFYATQQLLANQALTVFENNFNLTASVTNHPNPILAPESTSNLASVNTLFSANALSVDGTSDSVSPASQLNSPDIINAPTQLFVTNPTVSERDGVTNFTIQRTGDLSKSVVVSYITQDGDGKAGDRYLPVAGRALFAPNETQKTVSVKIPNDGRYTGNKQFGLLVSLLKEGNNLAELPPSFDLEADANGEQIRRWNLIKSDTQQGLLGGTLQFDTTVTNGQAQINLSVNNIGDFNSFYSYNPQISIYEELMLNASSTGATFTYSPQKQNDTPDGIQLNFIKDGDRGDVDKIINGLAKTNGYAGRTIPGLITNNNKTFWAPTTADGQVQWRLIGAPTKNYELGWILVDDQNGTINGLNPTDTGYEAAALARKQVVFQDQNSASNNSLTRTLAQESFTNPSDLGKTESQFFGSLENSNLEANRYYML
jgi:uncharacterized repeat protein (TIGR02059 family)